MAQPRKDRKQGRSVLEKRRAKEAKRAERATVQRKAQMRDGASAS